MRWPSGWAHQLPRTGAPATASTSEGTTREVGVSVATFTRAIQARAPLPVRSRVIGSKRLEGSDCIDASNTEARPQSNATGSPTPDTAALLAAPRPCPPLPLG